MKRWTKPRAFNPHQLQLDWQKATSPPVSLSQTAVGAGTEPPAMMPAPAIPPPIRNASPDLVQLLKWDFVTSFPEPLPDAIECGAIGEDDCGPENLRLLHDEYARQLLKVLREQDQLLGARRRSVDPKTGSEPKTHASRQRLKRFFDAEPKDLERIWQAIIGAYEAAFGEAATDAFCKAIRARHAGIPVIAENAIVERSATETTPAPASAATVLCDNATDDGSQLAVEHQHRRVSSRLPVPKPLPDAIAAGHFGRDENGPVHPSADEVRDITFNHAEELIETLAEQQEANRRGLAAVKDRLAREIQAAVVKYAEDFGERAGEQLLAYARRQMLVREEEALGRGR